MLDTGTEMLDLSNLTEQKKKDLQSLWQLALQFLILSFAQIGNVNQGAIDLPEGMKQSSTPSTPSETTPKLPAHLQSTENMSVLVMLGGDDTLLKIARQQSTQGQTSTFFKPSVEAAEKSGKTDPAAVATAVTAVATTAMLAVETAVKANILMQILNFLLEAIKSMPQMPVVGFEFRPTISAPSL